MVSKIYNEIENDINNTCLTCENKKILHNIHKMLYKYKNKKQLEFPILVLTKGIDNIDAKYIENLIEKMLEKYNLFDGNIKNTCKPVGISPSKLVASIESGKAYQIPIDDMALDLGTIDRYFNAIEKIVDTKCAFILLECMVDVEDIVYIHKLYQKIDYILSNTNTTEEISQILMTRYKHNKISTNIEMKELEKIVKNNLETRVYGTDEMCLQYMFTKSIKSFISSNRRKLEIADIPVIEKIENVIDELDNEASQQQDVFSNLTGLDYIKNELDKIIKFAIFNKEARSKNNNIPKGSLNMCFFGNPGTGKTTVARLIANEFYKNKIIEKNTLVEILPNDLMGEFVGHTKKAVRTVLDKARGGILFIDEAYQIASTGYKAGNPFMNEALTELLKYMENPDNIVIFAGYKEELEEMINMNPGIKSRISIKLEFNDYKTEELKQIVDNELTLYNLNLSPEADEKVIENINKAKKDFDFGNCRYVKNLALEIVKNHSYKNSKSKIILESEIPKYIKKQKKQIGFKREVVNG